VRTVCSWINSALGAVLVLLVIATSLMPYERARLGAIKHELDASCHCQWFQIVSAVYVAYSFRYRLETRFAALSGLLPKTLRSS